MPLAQAESFFMIFLSPRLVILLRGKRERLLVTARDEFICKLKDGFRMISGEISFTPPFVQELRESTYFRSSGFAWNIFSRCRGSAGIFKHSWNFLRQKIKLVLSILRLLLSNSTRNSIETQFK